MKAIVTCFDSSRRLAIIFLTLDNGLSSNPSPRTPSTAPDVLTTEAFSKSEDLIEPNKPEPWAMD